MTELLTSAQMRAIEGAAIASGEVTGLELMERAGQGVVEAMFAEWPELAKTSHRAVVLCGPGNNGGDGFVVARLLHGLGWAVEVFLFGDVGKLPPDARANYKRWQAIGDVTPLAGNKVSWRRGDLCIDALFGTGLTRGLPEALAPAWESLLDDAVDKDIRVVAVDIASGYCADSGRLLGDFEFGSDLEVSFHRAKLGHYVGPWARGPVVVTDIGIEPWQTKTWRSDPGLVRLVVVEVDGDAPDLLKIPMDHKYDHGHALILAGPSGKGGAARLAARGALRVGAGLVTLGPPHDALLENAAQLTAVMLTEVGDAATLARVLADKRINALALGPGLGLERARDLVPVALEAERATVLDADALTAFAEDPSTLFGLVHENCVLTPHAGEFARLFPDIAEKLEKPATRGPAYSKVDAARDAAKRAGCTVLFKGPDTVIADPSGRCAVNSAAYERAAPWLATAGSGDVLAGFIAGLLARGFGPMQASETAAWLHVEAARSFGPGLIAEDLPEELPHVFRALGL